MTKGELIKLLQDSKLPDSVEVFLNDVYQNKAVLKLKRVQEVGDFKQSEHGGLDPFVLLIGA